MNVSRARREANPLWNLSHEMVSWDSQIWGSDWGSLVFGPSDKFRNPRTRSNTDPGSVSQLQISKRKKDLVSINVISSVCKEIKQVKFWLGDCSLPHEAPTHGDRPPCSWPSILDFLPSPPPHPLPEFFFLQTILTRLLGIFPGCRLT